VTWRVPIAHRRLRGVRLDIGLAVLICVELELEIWLVPAPTGLGHERPLQSAAAVFFAAPIAARRRFPGAALLTFSAVMLLQAIGGGYLLEALDGSLIPPVILGFSAGSRLELRRSLAALLPALAALTAAIVVSDLIIPPPEHIGFVADELVTMLIVAAPWLVGRLARERSQRADAFRALGIRLESERDAKRRAAVAEERMRIGHELQDILAHSVSVMVIQTGAARTLLQTDRVRARDSILQVESTGREVLADLRRLLGVLRKDTDPRSLAPQPGLGELEPLLLRIEEHGLTCALTIEGASVPLTPGVNLVGYRVIEKALELALEHDAHVASVRLRYRPRVLELDVESDTSIAYADEDLTGIADRVALYDGTLRLSRGPGARYAVQATLPITAVTPG
jgi:signal transduction histidine kinase